MEENKCEICNKKTKEKYCSPKCLDEGNPQVSTLNKFVKKDGRRN